MSQPPSIKRIIWAVDAIQECTQIETRCLEAIEALTGQGTGGQAPVEVEPVFVMPPSRMAVVAPGGVYYPLQFHGDEVIHALEERLSGVASPRLAPLKVLDSGVLSTAGAVRELSRHAVDSGADVIVLGTHCRKGVSRMFLGSFAESLLLESRTPLLLVGAHVTRVGPIATVLYPTDFGPTSETVFPSALELARSLSAKLRIFHHVPGRHSRREEYRMLEGYARLARSEGIEPELVLDSGGSSVSEAILAAAGRGTDLIAMAAQSGWVRSTIAGSTTRQVVRGATCPVWVLHAREHERSRRTATGP